MSRRPPPQPTRQALRRALVDAHKLAELNLEFAGKQPFGPSMISLAETIGRGIATVPGKDRAFMMNVLICVMTHYANGLNGPDVAGHPWRELRHADGRTIRGATLTPFASQVMLCHSHPSFDTAVSDKRERVQPTISAVCNSSLYLCVAHSERCL